MEKEEEVDRRGGGKTILEWKGMDFASSTRVAEKQNKMDRDCCEIICGSPNVLATLCDRLDCTGRKHYFLTSETQIKQYIEHAYFIP